MATVLLVWGASPDDPTHGGAVVRYSVKRSTGPNATAEHASVPATAAEDDTFYRDDAVQAGTYFYRVTAVNAAGRQSPYSNEVSVTILPGQAHLVVILRLGAVPRLPVSLTATAPDVALGARPTNPITLAAHVN